MLSTKRNNILDRFNPTIFELFDPLKRLNLIEDCRWRRSQKLQIESWLESWASEVLICCKIIPSLSLGKLFSSSNITFILWGSFQLIFLNKNKVYFMSRSFAKPAFSRTATSNTKQSTTSTQNTFTFQNYLSYFGRWLEKSNELRSNWRF